MAKEVTIAIAEYKVVTKRKMKTVHFDLDGTKVEIPVGDDVKAYFDAQFLRDSPTKQQRQRFGTVMSLLRAAYRKGLEDGRG